MKNIATLFILFLTLSSPIYSQINLDKETEKGSTLLLKKGMTLVYGVIFEGQEYDFIVEITGFSNGVSFDYKMSNPEMTSGSVSISNEAIANSRSQVNNFEGGELNLTNQTTVWVSKIIFDELVSKGRSTISLDNNSSTIELGKVKAGHDYSIFNGLANAQISDLSYVYTESKDGSEKYWIQLNKYSPLILKMDLGWTIFLKELR